MFHWLICPLPLQDLVCWSPVWNPGRSSLHCRTAEDHHEEMCRSVCLCKTLSLRYVSPHKDPRASVCLYLFSGFAASNGYSSRPSAYYTSAGRTRTAAALSSVHEMMMTEEREGNDIFVNFHHVLCVCRLQRRSWRILRIRSACTRSHNKSFSTSHGWTDGGRAAGGSHSKQSE